MIVYTDLLSNDEMLADSYELTEVEDGFFYEVDGKWQVKGAIEVNTGANASAEEAEEGVEDGEQKVVDVVDSFRLVEASAYDKKGFLAYFKTWLQAILKVLPEDQHEEFKTKSSPAAKFLLAKIKDLQFFTGESMDPDGTMAYAYYKEGAADPTFLFPRFALKGQKV